MILLEPEPNHRLTRPGTAPPRCLRRAGAEGGRRLRATSARRKSVESTCPTPRSRWPTRAAWHSLVIGRDGTREHVIKMYEIYLRHSPDLIAALPELAGKRLGCYCKPLPCHGDVLVKLLAEFFVTCNLHTF